MPKEMEQMIRRLESGEDPEKLEEEFGDAFEGMDMPGEEISENPASPRHKLRRPVRDPALYEMSDFI
jgi:hypothetical protein